MKGIFLKNEWKRSHWNCGAGVGAGAEELFGLNWKYSRSNKKKFLQ